MTALVFERITPIIDADIGRRIREARKGLGLGQVQFAAAVGVSQAAISKIENGKSSPRVPVSRFAKALGMAPVEFLESFFGGEISHG